MTILYNLFVNELNNHNITMKEFSTTVSSGWFLHGSLLHSVLSVTIFWTLIFHKVV